MYIRCAAAVAVLADNNYQQFMEFMWMGRQKPSLLVLSVVGGIVAFVLRAIVCTHLFVSVI